MKTTTENNDPIKCMEKSIEDNKRAILDLNKDGSSEITSLNRNQYLEQQKNKIEETSRLIKAQQTFNYAQQKK